MLYFSKHTNKIGISIVRGHKMWFTEGLREKIEDSNVDSVVNFRCSYLPNIDN